MTDQEKREWDENESKKLGMNKEKLSLNKKELGRMGEDLAAAFLIKQGITIHVRNYRSPKGEIDIIARDADNTIIFVEVKLRTTAIRGYAEESINYQKRTKIQNTAVCYLLEQGYKEWPKLRFDFIAINMHEDKAKFNWIKNALV